MKILVAPNAFKESLDSIEVARHIAKGLQEASTTFRVVQIPLADGGIGTTRIITDVFDGKYVQCNITGPLNEPINALYGLVPTQKIAVMELAQAAGFHLVPKKKRNPLVTTTSGLGKMIVHALQRGLRKFIIGIGDSATIDCGVGALTELGIGFLDRNGRNIEPCCKGLLHLHRIDRSAIDPRSAQTKITIASDVKNILTGRYGAILYARQKGARPKDLPLIRKALRIFRRVVSKQFDTNLDTIPGSGAAGGIGGSFVALLNAQIISGSGLIQEIVHLEEEIMTSDVVITGEGRVDEESLYGKTLKRVVDIAYIHKKPVILIAGSIASGISLKKRYRTLEYYSLERINRSKKKAIENAGPLLERIAYTVGRKLEKGV
jgi:glycerate kinase